MERGLLMNDIQFDVSKLHKLMVHILRKIDKVLGNIEFAKMIYLIDLEAIKLQGKSISNEEYYREKKGPLVMGFHRRLDEMRGNEIEYKRVRSSGGSQFPKQNNKLGKNIRFNFDFTEQEEIIINRVLSRLEGKSPRELEDIAYSSEPMLALLKIEKDKGMKQYSTKLNLKTIKKSKKIEKWEKNMNIRESDHEYDSYLKDEHKINDRYFGLGEE